VVISSRGVGRPVFAPLLRRSMWGLRRMFSACRYAQPDRNRIAVNPAANGPGLGSNPMPTPFQARTSAATNRMRTSIQMTRGVRAFEAAWGLLG
jgi:hypothetical protein